MVVKTGNMGTVKKIVFHRENLIADIIPQLCGTVRKNLRHLVYKRKLIWFRVLEVHIQKSVLIYVFSGEGVTSS